MVDYGNRFSRRRFVDSLGKTAVAAVLPISSTGFSWAQTIGTEPEKSLVNEMRYPRLWTTPPQASVPTWARPGRIRFARWDGVALEAAKANLSGWPQFNPMNPDYLDSMVRWYDLRTIDLLRHANINLIWVTFSNGFSNETERRQQQDLRKYIAECHRYGIRTMAYESLTNIFSDDMFESVPESRDWLNLDAHGNPIPYNAANYKTVGRVTRYLADLKNPAWMAYVRGRIDLAIAAGADGIMYDNCMGPTLLEAIPPLMSYALSRKSDLLMMANFHREQFTYNHMLNAMTTEEGGEAGIFSGETMAATNNRWQKERPSMLPLDGGFLANNLGRMRIFWNLQGGWKPCMIESRQREAAGMAESRIITPSRQKLIMAENLMFNCAYEPSVEIEFAKGLAQSLPEAAAAWKAIGDYNQFAKENEACYVGAESCASIAIVLDNRSDGIATLNGLAARNVQFDIVYEEQLSLDLLKHYTAVALLAAIMVRESALTVLQEYVASGGTLYVAEESASQDENGRARVRPLWLDRSSSAGRCVYWRHLPGVDFIAAELATHRRKEDLRATLPPGVLYTVMQLGSPQRLAVHLANYTEHASQTCMFSTGRVRSYRLLTPDAEKPLVTMTRNGALTELTLAQVKIYSLLVLELET